MNNLIFEETDSKLAVVLAKRSQKGVEATASARSPGRKNETWLWQSDSKKLAVIIHKLITHRLLKTEQEDRDPLFLKANAFETKIKKDQKYKVNIQIK